MEIEQEVRFERLARRVAAMLYPRELPNRVCAALLGITERMRRTFALKPGLVENIKFGWRMEDLTNTIRDLVEQLTTEKLPRHGGTPDDDITYLTALSRAHERFLMCCN